MRPAAALLLLVACSPAPSMLPPLPVPDAGTPVPQPMPDAGMACDGVRDCRITWTTAADFPASVDHHSTFIANGFLYVAGGVNNTTMKIYDAVRRAPIAADGSLGAWVDCTKLPVPLGFHAMAQTATHVYLLAGVSEDAQGLLGSDYVFVGKLEADGDITWTPSPKRLNYIALHATAAVMGDALYIVGGTGNAAQSIVKRAKLNADGTLEDWTDGPSLPLQRSHHVAFMRDGKLYLAGGFDTGMTSHVDVLRSELDANGVITGWTVAGQLEQSPWTAGVVVYRDHVFILGGGEGGTFDAMYVNRVRRARFNADLSLSTFQDIDVLPAARAHVHQTPILDGRIYSVGGRQMDNAASISKVFIGAIGDRSE